MNVPEARLVNWDKNRDRGEYEFANINLLGRCNAKCFFCLGLDLQKELEGLDFNDVHFNEWKNFTAFLVKCGQLGIKKIYITGQNTDSLQYKYLSQLIDNLHSTGFKVGMRTNGYLALTRMNEINKCDCSVGYTIQSLDPTTVRMILGRSDIPDWKFIIPDTKNCRVQIVINRCNKLEFWKILRFLKQFKNIKYIQARRISTDNRQEELAADAIAYEEIYTQVRDIFPLKNKLWGDAEIYDIYGMDVCFWRTVKTTINSLNYFVDGTISDEYFIVEGYKKHCGKKGT